MTLTTAPILLTTNRMVALNNVDNNIVTAENRVSNNVELTNM